MSDCRNEDEMFVEARRRGCVVLWPRSNEIYYENAWSAGKVPQGLPTMKTPLPKVLQAPLPMKPPKRRETDE